MKLTPLKLLAICLTIDIAVIAGLYKLFQANELLAYIIIAILILGCINVILFVWHLKDQPYKYAVVHKATDKHVTHMDDLGEAREFAASGKFKIMRYDEETKTYKDFEG